MLISDEELEQVLLEKKLIDQKSLKILIASAKEKNKSLEDLLFEREIIVDEKLGEVMADLHKVPFVKLGDKTIAESLLRIVPYPLASHQFIIPFEKTPTEIKIAFNNPDNDEIINFLEKKTGLTVSVNYSTKRDIKSALKAYNRGVSTKFTKLLKSALKDPTKIESLRDAAKILDTIILFAYQNNVSDIHIEPHKDFIGIRYRIDGILRTITELPMSILDLLTTRIKVLSNLRTDEHRAAQDGRIKIDLENTEITLRVSIIPTYDGEKTVLRLLSSNNQELNVESLGFEKENLKTISRNITKTSGMILVTGPTGSGKTTTMYSILKQLNSPESNISTIEDPIEYRLEGVNQIQVNPKTNLTFSAGLRSILRQDPDILMVGEIRDKETAGIAINAALTGHLVLATLHTNDAVTTLPRMIDMGIETFLVAATVQLIIAQRLVRTICDKCKAPYEITTEGINTIGEKYNLKKELEEIFSKTSPENKITLYRGEGCTKCNNSGFKGRTTINEILEVSDSIRKMIIDGKSPEEIGAKAMEEGMVPLFVDGMQKVIGGKTSIEEALRVMYS